MSDSIPHGYKMTEVGIIPDDWEVVALKSIGPFKKGRNIPKSSLTSQGLPCVLYGEIYTKYAEVVTELVSRISIETAQNSVNILHGDILFAGSGETTEEIGKCFAYVGIEPAFAGGDLIILSPENSDSVFLGYLLNSTPVQRQKALLGQGSSVVHIYSSNLSKVLIPLPPTLTEQHAIADALSDVDAQITALDEAITKKRDLKQGAMQRLLTGEERLPGFSGEWEIDTISNLASITTGDKNTQDNIEDGKYPFFVRSANIERINSYTFDGEAVLTAGDGVGTGKIFHYIDGKFDFHQRVYKISNFADRLDGYYFYLYFSTYFYDRIMSMTAKSSVDSVRMEMIAGMHIPFPFPTEQRAIATILSDMDAEISVLEAQREKTVALKTGMMQELLTGKTRLI